MVWEDYNYKRHKGTVVYSQIDKIQSLIQAIEPKDIRVKYQKLYLENKYVPDEDFRAYRKTLEHKKAIAVKNIFDQFGAEEIEKFGHEVISALHPTDG